MAQDETEIHRQCKVTVSFKESSESLVHTLTRLKSSFSKTTSHFSSVSSGILLLGLDRISSNFFILLSFSTSVTINTLLLHSALPQMSVVFQSFNRSISILQSHLYITTTFSPCFIPYLFLLGLKYGGYYI